MPKQILMRLRLTDILAAAPRIVSFALLAAVFLNLPQANGQQDGADNDANDSVAFRVVPNKAFQVGERLDYIVRYGPIVAGNARIEVSEIVTVEGRECYRITSEAWSNSFFSKLYKVEDKVESLTDVKGLFSWRFEKKQHEGSFRDQQLVLFDQIEHTAITIKKTDRDTMKVPDFVQDVLSAMFYVRTQDLSVGDSVLVDNHSDRKIYPLKILVLGKEKVKTRAGKFECLVVEPFLQTPGLFQQKGRVVVYLTNDEKKLPVLMTSKIYVKAFDLGDVVAEVEKIEGVPGY